MTGLVREPRHQASRLGLLQHSRSAKSNSACGLISNLSLWLTNGSGEFAPDSRRLLAYFSRRRRRGHEDIIESIGEVAASGSPISAARNTLPADSPLRRIFAVLLFPNPHHCSLLHELPVLDGQRHLHLLLDSSLATPLGSVFAAEVFVALCLYFLGF